MGVLRIFGEQPGVAAVGRREPAVREELIGIERGGIRPRPGSADTRT
jgi:hypothetical protein